MHSSFSPTGSVPNVGLYSSPTVAAMWGGAIEGRCGLLTCFSVQCVTGEPMQEFNERMFLAAGLTVLAVETVGLFSSGDRKGIDHKEVGDGPE